MLPSAHLLIFAKASNVSCSFLQGLLDLAQPQPRKSEAGNGWVFESSKFIEKHFDTFSEVSFSSFTSSFIPFFNGSKTSTLSGTFVRPGLEHRQLRSGESVPCRSEKEAKFAPAVQLQRNVADLAVLLGYQVWVDH